MGRKEGRTKSQPAELVFLFPNKYTDGEIIFKGTLLKVDFSLHNGISCSVFSVDTCSSFMVFLQVADLQRRMGNHIHHCIKHAVGGFYSKTSSVSIAEVPHSFKKQFTELSFRSNLFSLSCPDIRGIQL